MSEIQEHSRTTKAKAVSMLSKKRFKDIENIIESNVKNKEMTRIIMDAIAQIMNFDINAKQYDPVVRKKHFESLKLKAQQTGITVYELSGQKKYQTTHRDAINKKSKELYKIKILQKSTI